MSESGRTSRRTFLSGSAALIPLPVLVSGPAIAGEDPLDRRLDILWRERTAARRAMNAAEEEYRIAVEQLPWWAAPGPMYIDHTGAQCGPNVGWPALQNVAPSDHPMVKRLIRPSFSEFKDRFEQNTRMWPTARATHRKTYRAGIRQVIALQRAARAEEAKLDLPRLDAKAEAETQWVLDVEGAIEDLPEDGGTTTLAAARLLLLVWDLDGISKRKAISVLRILAPMTTGHVRENVMFLLANPERPLDDFLDAAQA